jgi:hypothetical protein
MLRLFGRPSPDSADLDAEDASLPSESDELADGEGVSSGRRRTLKAIVAIGLVALGLGSLYLGFMGGHGTDLTLPRPLPPGRPSQAQPNPTRPSETPATPSTATVSASPPDASARATPPAERPTFYAPLPRDSRDATASVSGPEGGSYQLLAQASHDATMENLRSQIAELKLKKLKAELEADELRKNPKRLFKDERASGELKRDSAALERLARVPPSLLSTPAPIPAEHQAQASAAPTAPPKMRVRMVTLEPKEAVIETGDGDSHGWFTVREGQTFPDFVVTDVRLSGVTISFAGRGYFYPVGGYALGTPEAMPQPRQGLSREPPRR